MTVVPRSETFDDVYFSQSDGLAETRHVFLAGNDLPEAWAERAAFTICETGFGTGLNFLAVWKLWKAHKPAGATLHYISFEKYPVTGEYIADVLAHWKGEIGEELAGLVEKYPKNPKNSPPSPQEGGEGCIGAYRICMSDDVELTLVFGDVNEEMPKLVLSPNPNSLPAGKKEETRSVSGEGGYHLSAPVDCWFLDGFKPSSNPDMWSETVFSNMARLSRPGTSFATFTAAGFVRRGLTEAGFNVRKIPGFGRKREMAVGALTLRPGSSRTVRKKKAEFF